MATAAINIGVSDSLAMEVGLLSGSPPFTFTPFGGTTITWTNADDGTFPTDFITGSLGVVSAGDDVAVRTTETGTVTPSTSEVTVYIVFERTS